MVSLGKQISLEAADKQMQKFLERDSDERNQAKRDKTVRTSPRTRMGWNTHTHALSVTASCRHAHCRQ